MNSNWFKLVMKMTKVEYGKNLLLKGVPIIFNKGGAKLKIGENVTIKSSFLSNLVGLYSRTIIVILSLTYCVGPYNRTLKLQCLETALFAMDPLARIIMFIYINWLFNSCFLGTIKIKERIFGETNIKNISRVMGGFCCFSCCGVGNGGIWKSSL